MDSRFRPRNCPSCGSAEARVLAALRAAEFCNVNWSYADDWRSILGIGAEAEFPIVECTSCGFVYAALLPSGEFLEALYERVIRGDQCIDGGENRQSYARRLRYAADLIQLAPDGPAVALDFGSGIGVTMRMLAAAAARVTGFDPSASRATYGRSSDLVITNDFAVLAERGPFSIVIFDNVLEHLDDPAGTLARIAAMCVPAAAVYVSVPSYERPFLDAQLAAHREGRPIDMTFNPWEHLNYFSAETLDRLMRRAGFARIAAAALPHVPDIGLRPEQDTVARMRNAAATALRLARYAARGEGVVSAQHAFYRYVG